MTKVLLRLLISLMFVSAGGIAVADPVKILAFGDSLTAGYGLKDNEAFPVKLEQALIAKGHDIVVINSGQSGDTTGAGLNRVDWALFDQPNAVILELGANDMLRGLPVAKAREHLSKIVDLFQAESLPILMAGMLASETYGREYKAEFDAVFPELAAEKELMLYPFFLDGVAGDMALNQEDGIHPTAEGIDIIVANILPYVEEMLEGLATKP